MHGGQRPCSWFQKGLLEEAFADARSIITFKTMQESTLVHLSRPCRHPAVVALLSSAATILLCLALAAWHSSYTQSHPHLLSRKFLAERAGCADEHEQAQTGTVTLQSSDGRCSAIYIGLFCPFSFHSLAAPVFLSEQGSRRRSAAGTVDLARFQVHAYQSVCLARTGGEKCE